MKISTLIFFLFLSCFYKAEAQKRWSFEIHGGIVYNLRLPLIIYQKGFNEIRINRAYYQSEPFVPPFYWDWRFSRWNNKKSIEFEAIHHKLYLVNKPIEIQRFGISHGFNTLTLNHGREYKWFIFRIGLGSVLLHAESTIRKMKYPEGPGFGWKGYKLNGIVFNVAVAKQIKVGKYFFVNAEGKMTAAMANAEIMNGYARVYHVAFQIILGMGVNWCVKEKAKAKKDIASHSISGE